MLPQRKHKTYIDYTDMHHGMEPSPPLGEIYHSSVATDGEGHRDQLFSLEGKLVESDQHVARLQQMLQHERKKCTRLQQQCRLQETELRQREQLCNRLKERLSQLTDKHKQRAPSIEVLNLLPGGRREQGGKSARPNGRLPSHTSAARQETAALRLMLERQGAELREAMKLRHSITTLLHALRVHMQHTILDCGDEEDVHIDTNEESLVQSEQALGAHVTGGVVQGWMKVQKRLQNLLTGNSGMASDQDKVIRELETKLEASQELIRVQQQLLQDSLFSPALPALEDSYVLEECERLHLRWAELTQQKRSFERERHNFTEAVIKLSRERLDFEQKKGSLLKQRFLGGLPLSSKGSLVTNGEDRTALDVSVSGPLIVITTSPKESQISPIAGFSERCVQQNIQTPATPELYSFLGLSYYGREDESPAEEHCNDGSERMLMHTPHAQNLERSF